MTASGVRWLASLASNRQLLTTDLAMGVEANHNSVDTAKEGSIMPYHTMTTDEAPTLMAILEERKCLLTTIVRPLISDPLSLPPGTMVRLPLETHVLHQLRELLLR